MKGCELNLGEESPCPNYLYCIALLDRSVFYV